MLNNIKIRKLRKYIYTILSVFLLISTTSNGQNTTSDSSSLKQLVAAKEIMIAAGTCSLITLDDEGRPRARAMDPFIPEDDFTVWFGTNSNSRKVTQIKNDPRVTLYYFDINTDGYVVLNGIAQLVNDPVKKEEYWKKKWEDYYPNKSDNYLLIKVSPIWIEILSPTHGIYNNPKTWQPPIIFLNSEK